MPRSRRPMAPGHTPDGRSHLHDSHSNGRAEKGTNSTKHQPHNQSHIVCACLVASLTSFLHFLLDRSDHWLNKPKTTKSSQTTKPQPLSRSSMAGSDDEEELAALRAARGVTSLVRCFVAPLLFRPLSLGCPASTSQSPHAADSPPPPSHAAPYSSLHAHVYSLS